MYIHSLPVASFIHQTVPYSSSCCEICSVRLQITLPVFPMIENALDARQVRETAMLKVLHGIKFWKFHSICPSPIDYPPTSS